MFFFYKINLEASYMHKGSFIVYAHIVVHNVNKAYSVVKTKDEK